MLLEPLEKATKYLSASSYPTLGDIYLIFGGIMVHLRDHIEQENFTQCEMASSILQKLEEYWNIMDRASITSAILDSRNKLTIFSSEKIDAARTHIQAVYNLYSSASLNISITQPTSINTTNTTNTTRQYFAQLRRQATSTILTTNIASELSHYLDLQVDEEMDPLLWWKVHAKEYPIVSKMARDYLTIQATSVASEQAFSIAGQAITARRNRLDPETARASLCLRSWIRNNLYSY